MIKIICAFLVSFFWFSLQAYEFDVVIKNNSKHGFNIERDVKIPGVQISDTQYFSDSFETSEILSKKEVRCYISLSIKDYITSAAKNVITLKGDKGSFFMTFSKVEVGNYPTPILLNSAHKEGRDFKIQVGKDLFLGEMFVAAKEVVDGDYKITYYFDREFKEYVVDIDDK